MIKSLQSILLLFTLVMIVYAGAYLLGWDPNILVGNGDEVRGALYRGLARMSVFISVASLLPLLWYQKLWSAWTKVMLWALPIFALLYWWLSADSLFWFGPIAAAQILGPAFVVITWVALGRVLIR